MARKAVLGLALADGLVDGAVLEDGVVGHHRAPAEREA